MFDSPFIVPIVVIPSVLMFIMLVGPFRKPLSRWLTHKAEGGEGGLLHEDVAEQGERLAEAERRIAELEERLDFTERLLTHGGGAEQARKPLPGPDAPITPR